MIYYTDNEVSGTHIDLRDCDGPRVGDDGGEAALEFLVHQLKNAHKKHLLIQLEITKRIQY